MPMVLVLWMCFLSLGVTAGVASDVFVTVMSDAEVVNRGYNIERSEPA